MELLSWTGLVLNGFIDFFCPALVAFTAVRLARRRLTGNNNNIDDDDDYEQQLQRQKQLFRGATEASTGRGLPPTVVNALPAGWLRDNHEGFVACLAAAIVVLVGLGFIVKATGTVAAAAAAN
jgi:hypothetical protein